MKKSGLMAKLKSVASAIGSSVSKKITSYTSKSNTAKIQHERKEPNQKSENRPEKSGRQKIADYIRSEYNMKSEERITKLTDIVINEYKASHGSKTVREILDEEQKYSKEYREFLDYSEKNPDNFVAKSIVKLVNSEYYINREKKSIARIFNNIREDNSVSMQFRYNPRFHRYEAKIEDLSIDIRDLDIHKTNVKRILKEYGVRQDNYKSLIEQEKDEAKTEAIYELDYATQGFTEGLEKFGLFVDYKGFDKILEDKYQPTQANLNRILDSANNPNTLYSNKRHSEEFVRV